MQQWQFYLHMLALGVIILLLYLFFREYKANKAQMTPVAATPAPVASSSRPPFPVQAPLSHAHLQTMQADIQPRPTFVTVSQPSTRFETESNLDRELSAEINDLGLLPEVVDDARSDAGSQSNASCSSAEPRVSGSPIRQVIEFVPRKQKRKPKEEAPPPS